MTTKMVGERLRILVVEDEAPLRANITRFLSRSGGHTITAVESGQDAIAQLDRVAFDLVITDLRLPDPKVDGLNVLDHARATSPETAVLIMTAYASVESAVEALRRGAHDYVLKPLSLFELERKVQHVAKSYRLHQENARLRRLVSGGEDGHSMALLRQGHEKGPMDALCKMIEKVAALGSTSNVLIRGESGTGKELVARAIHEQSERSSGPFVSLDVTAIPEDGLLLDSYLFGHERAALLGPAAAPTRTKREGVFRSANGGTLFLDEVGELSMDAQAKLLRAVETKEIHPVGAEEPLCVDTRIVAATHRDLAAMVADGKFRQDLFYRLQVLEIAVPPLRDRGGEDILNLARHFALLQSKKQGKKNQVAIAPEAKILLGAYRWPGNVRELSNVIERAVILASADTIVPTDLPTELRLEEVDDTPAKNLRSPNEPPISAPSVASVASATNRARENNENTDDDDAAIDPDLDRATLAFHRKHIARVLDHCGGNREATAKLLGLSPATFYRYLQRVGLRGYRAVA